VVALALAGGGGAGDGLDPGRPRSHHRRRHGSVLQKPETLKFTSTQVGLQATIYLIGAVLGSLWFGYLTDRLGRKRCSTSPSGST
jgi:MFS family permease